MKASATISLPEIRRFVFINRPVGHLIARNLTEINRIVSAGPPPAVMARRRIKSQACENIGAGSFAGRRRNQI
jgi:hypothetical protein